jgi:hypothetical protein
LRRIYSNPDPHGELVPINELVSKVIQLVEVGLAELQPVKVVTVTKKMRASVATIFGEIVKAPSKKQTEAKSSEKPTPMPRPKGRNTQGTQGRGIRPQATKATRTSEKDPQNTKTISPTQGKKRQQSPGNENECPCHKQVTVVQTDVDADLSDAVSEFDFSLLGNTPSKEVMVFSLTQLQGQVCGYPCLFLWKCACDSALVCTNESYIGAVPLIKSAQCTFCSISRLSDFLSGTSSRRFSGSDLPCTLQQYISKFRMSSHKLVLEQVRYYNVARNQRICKMY